MQHSLYPVRPVPLAQSYPQSLTTTTTTTTNNQGPIVAVIPCMLIVPVPHSTTTTIPTTCTPGIIQRAGIIVTIVTIITFNILTHRGPIVSIVSGGWMSRRMWIVTVVTTALPYPETSVTLFHQNCEGLDKQHSLEIARRFLGRDGLGGRDCRHVGDWARLQNTGPKPHGGR